MRKSRISGNVLRGVVEGSMIKKILVLLFLIIGTGAYGQAMVSEDVVKAAFIFHFINFVEWNDHQPEYYICIPDDDSFRASVEGSLKWKVINGRKIVVVNRSDTCHILVSDNVPKTDSMLTIGPLAKGALLEFRVVENKLKFAASLQNIKKSKLKISSQLLKLAILEKGS